MNAFSIRDLENLTGIKAHTIRAWEQRYSFLRPQRTDTNIRYYSNDELKVLLNIALLNKFGFKISHIDRMSELEIKNKANTLSQTQAQQERIISELITCMVDMDTEQFESLLDGYILTRGIEKAITQILFPFLERMGILWATSHINPAQEHLVSNIIRQKLLVGIDKLNAHIRPGKTAILFLPESQYHEIGLLFVAYTLKAKGVSIYYLGASIPLVDVAYLVSIKRPTYLYTHLSSAAHSFSMEKFLNNFKQQIPDLPLYASGYMFSSYEKSLPDNVNVFGSMESVLESPELA